MSYVETYCGHTGINTSYTKRKHKYKTDNLWKDFMSNLQIDKAHKIKVIVQEIKFISYTSNSSYFEICKKKKKKKKKKFKYFCSVDLSKYMYRFKLRYTSISLLKYEL